MNIILIYVIGTILAFCLALPLAAEFHLTLPECAVVVLFWPLSGAGILYIGCRAWYRRFLGES